MPITKIQYEHQASAMAQYLLGMMLGACIWHGPEYDAFYREVFNFYQELVGRDILELA